MILQTQTAVINNNSMSVVNTLMKPFAILTTSDSTSVMRKQAAPENGAVPRVLAVEIVWSPMLSVHTLRSSTTATNKTVAEI